MCFFSHPHRIAPRWPQLAFAVGLLGALVVLPAPSSAEHGDYLLGTLGLFGGAQAPEGIYYQNIFSYYNAGNYRALTASRTRDFQTAAGDLGLTVTGNLDLRSSLTVYADQNIIGMTTPFKIPILGATYGFSIDIPFVQVDGTGAASCTGPSRGGSIGAVVAGATCDAGGLSTDCASVSRGVSWTVAAAAAAMGLCRSPK